MKLIRVLSTKPYTLPSNKGINVIQIDRACHARDPFFPALHVQFGILNLGVWWHLASFARFVGLYSQPYSIHRFALLYIQTRRILATDCTSTCTYTYLLHILSSSSQKINQTLLFNFFYFNDSHECLIILFCHPMLPHSCFIVQPPLLVNYCL